MERFLQLQRPGENIAAPKWMHTMTELLASVREQDRSRGTIAPKMFRVSRLPSGQPEIFASIQGEGPSCGRPSVFLRLAHCNLGCSWCDTKYTWDWQRHDARKEVRELSLAQVGTVLDALEPNNLVVTGGEPLLQQDSLAVLLKKQKRRGRRIEVETNGTIPPGQKMTGLVDQWNVSPKLANSGEPGSRRLVTAVLKAYRDDPKAFFKFVVQHPNDIPEVERIVDDIGLPLARVYLMPEATDQATLRERSHWLSEQCARTGFHLSPRLHVERWGGTRGR